MSWERAQKVKRVKTVLIKLTIKVNQLNFTTNKQHSLPATQLASSNYLVAYIFYITLLSETELVLGLLGWEEETKMSLSFCRALLVFIKQGKRVSF